MSLSAYTDKLNAGLSSIKQESLNLLVENLRQAWDENKQVLVCGNGGSAANALHWVNDFVYGLACGLDRTGMRAIALNANQAVMTCLANDTGYDNIFAEQVNVFGQKGDVLIVLSGSGNSQNIIEAIKMAKSKGMQCHAILGYDGGQALGLADNSIHIQLDDMQVAEDAQLIVGHYVVRAMREQLKSFELIQDTKNA